MLPPGHRDQLPISSSSSSVNMGEGKTEPLVKLITENNRR